MKGLIIRTNHGQSGSDFYILWKYCMINNLYTRELMYLLAYSAVFSEHFVHCFESPSIGRCCPTSRRWGRTSCWRKEAKIGDKRWNRPADSQLLHPEDNITLHNWYYFKYNTTCPKSMGKRGPKSLNNHDNKMNSNHDEMSIILPKKNHLLLTHWLLWLTNIVQDFTFIGFGMFPKLLLACVAPKLDVVLNELPPKSAMMMFSYLLMIRTRIEILQIYFSLQVKIS